MGRLNFRKKPSESKERLSFLSSYFDHQRLSEAVSGSVVHTIFIACSSSAGHLPSHWRGNGDRNRYVLTCRSGKLSYLVGRMLQKVLEGSQLAQGAP